MRELRDAVTLFESAFGHTPIHGASAPGRVNLLGEHTDYNDGFVLPMAIDLACVAVGRLTDEPKSIAVASAQSSGGEIVRWRAGDEAQKRRGWHSLVAGVIDGLSVDRHELLQQKGLEIAISSSVPMGGGLASSAALEVATATLIAEMLDLSPTAFELARICQIAEHDYAGVPCGLMDQSVAACARNGHAMLLDCRQMKLRHIKMPEAGQAVVMVANSNIKHALADTEYGRRRQGCTHLCAKMRVESLRDANLDAVVDATNGLTQTEQRLARHVIQENERTIEGSAALARGDFRTFGRLMTQSHESLRDNFQVSCAELDLLVEIALQCSGVLGAKMSGAGFGGCVVALVEPYAVGALRSKWCQEYLHRASRPCDVHVFQAVGGAGVIDPSSLRNP